MTTQRPFLEKLSWIATIAGPFFLVYGLFKPSTTVNISSDKRPETQTLSLLPTTKPLAIDNKEEKNARWSCEGIASDLQSAFTAAKNIRNTPPRDEALFSLARKALCLEDYSMFDDVAKQIAHTNHRNQAYVAAVEFALNVRKFDIAERFAEKIESMSVRDATYARIGAKASER